MESGMRERNWGAIVSTQNLPILDKKFSPATLLV